MELTEEQIEELYQWVDTIPLSRRKRHLPRDFSDGVLMAEVIHNFMPRIVDLHNYEQGLRVDTKIYNWKTLNSKVLKKIGLQLDTETITGLAHATPGFIDKVLWNFKQIAEAKVEKKEKVYFDDPTIPELVIVQETEKERDREDERKMLLEKLRECEEQAEYIEALESKISKLEELMELKDAKIAKLEGQLRKKTRNQ